MKKTKTYKNTASHTPKPPHPMRIIANYVSKQKANNWENLTFEEACNTHNKILDEMQKETMT